MFGRFNRRFGPPWARPDWDGPRGHHHHHGEHPHHDRHHATPQEQALHVTAAEVARLFQIATRGSQGNAQKQAQLRTFLERSRKELSDLIYDTTATTSASTDTPSRQA